MMAKSQSQTHTLHTQALEALFDKPIAYHPVFARITKSVKAGIFLSQAFYWAPRTSDPDRWFYKVQEEWEEETCLTRREQETAREKLRELGILEEALRDMPAKLYFRLNYEHLVEILNAYVSQDGGKCHTRMAESAKHGCTKQPDMVAQNSHTTTESTTESTTERRTTPNGVVGTEVSLPTDSAPAAVSPPGIVRSGRRKVTPLAKDDWLYQLLSTQDFLPDLPLEAVNDADWWASLSHLVDEFNEEFLRYVLASMATWMKGDARKKPRSNAGWVQFIRNWFVREGKDQRKGAVYAGAQRAKEVHIHYGKR